MSFRVFLLIPFVFHHARSSSLYWSLLKHERLNRHCHETSSSMMPDVEDSKVSVFLILVSGLLFLLIFLGLIKGLIGLWCWSKAGVYGLNLLIDLPRQLTSYQEKELEKRPIVYDIGGWPIHPDTLERSVRVLPKRTEFCLNLVFFLACPLAGCVYICGLCCCIRNMRKSQENACFKHVDVVRLTDTDNSKHKKKSSETTRAAASRGMDVYKGDYKEEQDTKYVMDAMKESEESFHEYHINIRTCSCHNE